MKRIHLFVAILLSVIYLCSCSSSEYQYIDGNGEGYIVYTHPTSSVADGAGLERAPRIYFSSVEEMITDIYSGNFTEIEKLQLAQFKHDDHGRIIVCDLDNIYCLNVPDGTSYTIDWYGIGYDYSGTLVNGRLSGKIVSQERWSEELDEYLEPINAGRHPWAFDDNRNAAVYRVRVDDTYRYRAIYQIDNGATEIHVIENFAEYPNSLKSIRLYCVYNSTYFILYLTPSIGESFLARPSVEYLKQFGIELYTNS